MAVIFITGNGTRELLYELQFKKTILSIFYDAFLWTIEPPQSPIPIYLLAVTPDLILIVFIVACCWNHPMFTPTHLFDQNLSMMKPSRSSCNAVSGGLYCISRHYIPHCSISPTSYSFYKKSHLQIIGPNHQ